MKNQNIRFHWSIDQLQIISNNLDLDIIDWSIYEVMKQFFLSGKCEKKQFNGDTYYRYEWQNIPEQAPILKISTKAAVYRRYENLSKANLLHPMELPDGTISKRFFRLGEMHEIVMNTKGDVDAANLAKKTYSEKSKKLGESNTVNARLDRKRRFTPVNDGLQNTEKTVNDGLQNLPKTVNDGLLYKNTNIDKNTIEDKNTITPFGENLLSQDEMIEIEEQIEAHGKLQKPPHIPPAPPTNSRKPSHAKWNGSFKIAQSIFEEHRNQWSMNRFGIEDKGLFWTGKEIGQLSNLLTMLKSKAIQNGDVYETDVEFVQSELPIFLAAATKLNCYYSNEFTPTLFSSKFNTVVTDIKNYLKNGNANSKGRNGHQFDPERTRQMESLLD